MAYRSKAWLDLWRKFLICTRKVQEERCCLTRHRWRYNACNWRPPRQLCLIHPATTDVIAAHTVQTASICWYKLENDETDLAVDDESVARMSIEEYIGLFTNGTQSLQRRCHIGCPTIIHHLQPLSNIPMQAIKVQTCFTYYIYHLSNSTKRYTWISEGRCKLTLAFRRMRSERGSETFRIR